MMADPRAALLREFVRLRIPHKCEAVAEAIVRARRSRRARFLLDLRELRRRMTPGHAQWLNVTDFNNAVDRLNEAYDFDFDDIERNADHAHFQAWRATDVDWRRLAVGLAFDREPSNFGVIDEDSRAGDDHWYFDLVMSNLVSQSGGNATKASRKAAEYVNARIDAGEFTRQSAENPKEHVEAVRLRQVYSSRKAARDRHAAKMLPDSLDVFAAWTYSPDCPIPQQTLAEILPPNGTMTQWAEDEAAMRERLQIFSANRTLVDDADEQAIYLQFYRSLSEREKEEFSAWGRLQAHLDNFADTIEDKRARDEFGATRQNLISAFLRHRHVVNHTLMEAMIDSPPSYVRRALYIDDCFRAAMQAADSLSARNEL